MYIFSKNHILIERRRRLAATCPLPLSLATSFTTSEQAVLRIVADECRSKGSCTRCIAEIASRAGVSRTTVQNTMRRARAMNIVKVEERPVSGAKNLPNRITIISNEWRSWIRHNLITQKLSDYAKQFIENKNNLNKFFETHEITQNKSK